MPDSRPAAEQKKQPNESMLASATYDSTPRVGVVLSSYKGSAEHDGTPIAGLADPRPVDATLTLAHTAAMLAKAQDLGQHTLGRNRGAGGPPSDEWVVFLVTRSDQISTDPVLLGALLASYAQRSRGRRFTVAGGGPPLPGYTERLRDLAGRYPRIRFEYADLATEPYLQVPAIRRTFAAHNREGVYAIAKVIRECDRLISVAPLQTSPLTGVALTISNYWSLAPTSVYGPNREKLLALGNPVDVLTDLYLHHPADYAILGGPVHRDAQGPVHHNLVIAGLSALAVDAIGAAVMGFAPAKLPLLDKLELRGFGILDPESIWTRGNEIAEARRPFRRPAGWEGL